MKTSDFAKEKQGQKGDLDGVRTNPSPLPKKKNGKESSSTGSSNTLRFKPENGPSPKKTIPPPPPLIRHNPSKPTKDNPKNPLPQRGSGYGRKKKEEFQPPRVLYINLFYSLSSPQFSFFFSNYRKKKKKRKNPENNDNNFFGHIRKLVFPFLFRSLYSSCFVVVVVVKIVCKQDFFLFLFLYT